MCDRSSKEYLRNLNEALKHNMDYQKTLEIQINKLRSILIENSEKQVCLDNIL